MLSTLSSRKCCSVLSRVTLVNELPSSLTLVLDPMMTPGNSNSSRMAEYTALRVLLLGRVWVLFYLIHLDWICLVESKRTVFFNFFSNYVTNFLQTGVSRSLLALYPKWIKRKVLSFWKLSSATLEMVIREADFLLSASRWLMASMSAVPTCCQRLLRVYIKMIVILQFLFFQTFHRRQWLFWLMSFVGINDQEYLLKIIFNHFLYHIQYKINRTNPKIGV